MEKKWLKVIRLLKLIEMKLTFQIEFLITLNSTPNLCKHFIMKSNFFLEGL